MTHQRWRIANRTHDLRKRANNRREISLGLVALGGFLGCSFHHIKYLSIVTIKLKVTPHTGRSVALLDVPLIQFLFNIHTADLGPPTCRNFSETMYCSDLPRLADCWNLATFLKFLFLINYHWYVFSVFLAQLIQFFFFKYSLGRF